MIKSVCILITMLITLTASHVYAEDLHKEKAMNNLENRFTIYYIKSCPYCSRAIAFLDSHKMIFDAVDISDNRKKWDELKIETGSNTVPYIFLNDEYIGGCDDLLSLHKSGQLSEMLSER